MELTRKLWAGGAAVLLAGTLSLVVAPAANATQFKMCQSNTSQGTLTACIDPGDSGPGYNIRYSSSVYFHGNPGYTSCTLSTGTNGNFVRTKNCLTALKYGGTVSDYFYDLAVRGNYTSAKVQVCAGFTCAISQINSPKNE